MAAFDSELLLLILMMISLVDGENVNSLRSFISEENPTNMSVNMKILAQKLNDLSGYKYRNVKLSGTFVVDFMDPKFQYNYYMAQRLCQTNKRRGGVTFDTKEEELEFLWLTEFNPEQFRECPVRWTGYRKILDNEWESMDGKVTAFGSLSDMWGSGNKFAGKQCIVVDYTLKLRAVSCFQPTVCFLCELDVCSLKNDRCFKLMAQNIPTVMAAHKVCQKRNGRLAAVRSAIDLLVITEFLQENGALKKDRIFHSTKSCHTVTLGMKAKRRYESFDGEPMTFTSRLISMRKGSSNNQCLVFSPYHFFRMVPEDCNKKLCVICRKKLVGEYLDPP